jgi:hypothetical protein
LGIYEYYRLWFHYYFIKAHSREFFFSSLFYSILNSLIQTLGIGLLLTIISRYAMVSLFSQMNFSFLLFCFIGNTLIFALASFLTLAIRLLPRIGVIIYPLILGFVIFIFGNHFHKIIYHISNFLTNKSLLYKTLPFLVLGCSIFFILIYLELKILKNKKALSLR